MPLWPTVGRQLHLGRTATFEAHKRGEIPFPVWRIGGRLVCPTAAVRAAFGLPTTCPDVARRVLTHRLPSRQMRRPARMEAGGPNTTTNPQKGST